MHTTQSNAQLYFFFSADTDRRPPPLNFSASPSPLPRLPPLPPLLPLGSMGPEGKGRLLLLLACAAAGGGCRAFQLPPPATAGGAVAGRGRIGIRLRRTSRGRLDGSGLGVASPSQAAAGGGRRRPDADTDADTDTDVEERVAALERENERLRGMVGALEDANAQLITAAVADPGQIVIERFEGGGEGMGRDGGGWWGAGGDGAISSAALPPTDGNWYDGLGFDDEPDDVCDVYEDGTCPVEPEVTFGAALRDRSLWLVGLLAVQSLSGVILAGNEDLIAAHPVIVYFLTMLVGAGGNAGNQASVRVIRGLALGTLNERTQRRFLNRELKMALCLCGILSCAGFVRAAVFRTPFPETIAITASLALIVLISVTLGAVLPLLMKRLGVDPAHASTTIQVIMDILGVVLTVVVSTAILDSPGGHWLVSRLLSG